MAPPPVVTGISPKEGPPGTRVTIRGEFLGTKPTDLASRLTLYYFYVCLLPSLVLHVSVLRSVRFGFRFTLLMYGIEIVTF